MSKLEELIQQYCPDGVEFKLLGEVCDIHKGVQFNKSDMQDEGTYPVINGGINPSGYVEVFNEEENTITISQGGASAGYVNFLLSKFWLGAHCYAVKPTNEVKNRYLYHFIKQNEITLQQCQYGAGIPALAKGTITSLEIPIPPLPVQEEIVRILDTFTELQAELQAELQKRLQQYNYYRDNLLSFEGRTDVEWKKLGDVCLKTDNIKWKSTKETYQYIDLTSVDIQTHNILSTMEIDSSSAPSRAQQIVKEDDVIFATTRPTQMRACLVPVEYDGQICSTGYCVLRPDSSIVLPQYLFFVLAVESFKTYLLNNQTMGNYPSISNNTLKDYTIPIPSISEQRKIVSVLDRFDTLTCDLVAGLPAEIEKRRKQYEFYRDKLLTFKKKEA